MRDSQPEIIFINRKDNVGGNMKTGFIVKKERYWSDRDNSIQYIQSWKIKDMIRNGEISRDVNFTDCGCSAVALFDTEKDAEQVIIAFEKSPWHKMPCELREPVFSICSINDPELPETLRDLTE